MANCSDFTLNLSGHPFKLKQARDEFIKNHHEFSLREIYSEEFSHTPPTWELHGKGRWGVDIDSLIDFLEPFELSGTIADAEPGSDFFIKIWLENGIITNSKHTGYVSDEHYNHCPDNQFWCDMLSYALEEPNEYKEQIAFMIKHNIITKEDLE